MYFLARLFEARALTRRRKEARRWLHAPEGTLEVVDAGPTNGRGHFNTEDRRTSKWCNVATFLIFHNTVFQRKRINLFIHLHKIFLKRPGYDKTVEKCKYL